VCLVMGVVWHLDWQCSRRDWRYWVEDWNWNLGLVEDRALAKEIQLM
jgi:hypothetical protein